MLTTTMYIPHDPPWYPLRTYPLHHNALRPVLFLAIIAAVAGCSRSLPELSIDHRHSIHTFAPQYESQTIDSLTVTIYPLDAAAINDLMHDAWQQDGAYEDELIIFRVDYPSEPGLNRQQQRKLSHIRSMIPTIQEHLDSGYFDNEAVVEALIRRLWLGEHVGFDGSEIEILSESISYHTPTYNPYYIDGRYLSVFKLNITNHSRHRHVINREQIQVGSGLSISYPLPNEYFESRFSDDTPRMINLMRHNIPETLNIPPRSTVETFIAIPPIDAALNSVIVYLNSESSTSEFTFEIDYQSRRLQYQLSQFVFSPSRISQSDYDDIVFAIQLEDGIIPIAQDFLFIDLEQQPSVGVVCGLAASYRRGRNWFGCSNSIRFDATDSRRIRIPMNAL